MKREKKHLTFDKNRDQKQHNNIVCFLFIGLQCKSPFMDCKDLCETGASLSKAYVSEGLIFFFFVGERDKDKMK